MSLSSFSSITHILRHLLGPPGPPGPPGDGLGYDANNLAALLAMGQINNQKGPDSMNDEPIRIFGKEMSDEERNELVMMAYEQLKTSFDKIRRPDGQKKTPGKTCRDIWAAYPESPSGKMKILWKNDCWVLMNFLCRPILDRSK